MVTTIHIPSSKNIGLENIEHGHGVFRACPEVLPCSNDKFRKMYMGGVCCRAQGFKPKLDRTLRRKSNEVPGIVGSSRRLQRCSVLEMSQCCTFVVFGHAFLQLYPA